jgi:hypothetical protein
MVLVTAAVTAVVITALGTWAAARVRSYRGIHRRQGTAPPARRRAAARRAGRAGRGAWPESHAGSCACGTCSGSGVVLALDPGRISGGAVYRPATGTLCSLDGYGNSYPLSLVLSRQARDNIYRGLGQFLPDSRDYSEWDLGVAAPPAPAPAGLRYVPKPDFPVRVQLPDSGSNYAAAVAYLSRGGGMKLSLHTSAPPPAGTSPAVVSGSGYSSGGRPGGKSWRQAEMVRQLTGDDLPPLIAGAVPAQPQPPNAPIPRFSSGGLIPSPLAPTASTPPARRTPAFPPRRGMDGFGEADFIAGSVFGYRWWTLQAPPLEKNPARAARDWNPPWLRGVKACWTAGENAARCLPESASLHAPSEVPHIDCSCGHWGYWQIQHHDVGGSNRLPVTGVVEGYGQLLTGPLGFRAGKAKIVALYLPLLIEPDLPVKAPGLHGSGPSWLYPAGQQPDGRPNPWYAHPKFSGAIIGNRDAGRPQSQYTLAAPPEPDPPTAEEVAEAEDRAMAWTAVIEDRLQVMYPDAEIFASLDLMLAKFPACSQYTPPPASGYCGLCSMPCEDLDAHHIVAHP